MARPSTQPEINAYRRNAIVKAAIECAAEAGIEGATIRSIAFAAGISPGLVSHYFESREHVLAAAHEALCTMIEEEVLIVLADTALTPAARLKALTSTIFSARVFNVSHARAFLAFWHASSVYARIRQNHERLYKGYREDIAAVVAEMGCQGATAMRADLAATMLLGMIDGLWLQLTMEREMKRERAVEALHGFIDTWIAADFISPHK